MGATHTHLALELLPGLLFSISLITFVILGGGLFPLLATLAAQHVQACGIILIVTVSLLLRGCRPSELVSGFGGSFLMRVDGLLHGLLLFFALDSSGTVSAAGATAAASTSVFFFSSIIDGGHGCVELEVGETN
jgi:hypothetical protein